MLIFRTNRASGRLIFDYFYVVDLIEYFSMMKA